MHQFTLQPEDNERLQNLCGFHHENLTAIEHHFCVQIHHRGFEFKICGEEPNTIQASKSIHSLYTHSHLGPFTRKEVHQMLLSAENHSTITNKQAPDQTIIISVGNKTFTLSTANQIAYLEKLQDANNTITFATGPAGTGKTFLAVLMALKMLKEEKCKRIILTRPVIEAGEQLGFLPGDVMEKTYPYLQPLYDAMYQILSKQEIDDLIEKNIIEIAPLAFMRGRTFNESFMILDESQNTTQEQMKMFLTRIGHHSKVVVTGDDSQMDITHKQSGLILAKPILHTIKGIDFIELEAKDIRRHRIVQLITQAYQNHQDKTIA